MVDILTAFFAGVISTFVPLYLGVFAPRTLRWHSERSIVFLAAAALGILFWFFLDVMGDASYLGISEGFGGDYTHAVLIISFASCLAALFWLEDVLERRFPNISGASAQAPLIQRMTFVIAALVALGFGLHALGEGDAIGANLPLFPTILEAIGGVGGGIAYVLHKFLEGYVVGVFALLASSISTRQLGILGAIAGIPTLIGFFLGASVAPESSYFFALSGASVIYACVKVIPRIAGSDEKYVIVAGSLAGFYAMYFAGLFHVA